MTFFSRITVSERIILDSRPKHLKTSNASLSIPGFQRSHHAPSGPAGQYGGLLDEHQRRSKVSEATTIRSGDSTGIRRAGIMIFLELMAFESFKGATNIERNGIKGSDLMVFSFATIVAATINLQVRISLDKVEVVIILQKIDQLSMMLSIISDASRLCTSGNILSDMGIVKTKHGYFLLFLAQS
ncbi:hypothetical protein Tco_0908665 [Tanacetum coccineum]|uniref:Uncharacterized protein n=1 Tax=Tanacetum coccineum TaxID=301880 RepID=A0ABQ5CNX9_9ASTR